MPHSCCLVTFNQMQLLLPDMSTAIRHLQKLLQEHVVQQCARDNCHVC